MENKIRKIIREQIKKLNETYNRGPVSIDGKEVDVDSIEIDGVDWRGGHDDGTTDRYVAAASFIDGTPLTDEQRNRLGDEYPELTQELAIDQHFQQEGFHMSQRPTYGQDLKLEPEDMDNPDEDLVIIGSGALDIENKFGERPPQTNGEYAAKGQEFVDKHFKGNKEAAMDYIMKKINETNDPEDDEEQAEYDKGWYGESLKEAASELGYLKEDYKPSHRAYDVIDKSNNDEIVAKKLSYDRALEKAHTNPNYKIKATQRLAENNQKYYDLLNDLRDEGHLHRYGIIRLQLQFGLKEKEAQEIYNEYIEDLKAEQPDAADFYLKTLNKND